VASVIENATIAAQIAAITNYGVSRTETAAITESQTVRYFWEIIDDTQTANWQNINNVQSSGWTPVPTT
jgi:hypothetical protein